MDIIEKDFLGSKNKEQTTKQNCNLEDKRNEKNLDEEKQ